LKHILTISSFSAFEFLQLNYGDRLNSLFIFLDLATAFVLGRLALHLARQMLVRQARDVKEYHVDAKDIILTKVDADKMAERVQLAYLFNPYVVVFFVGFFCILFFIFLI
jgi:uncharacterized membrane protein